MTPQTPKLVSVNKASLMLGLAPGNPATLFRLCLKGRIEYVCTDDDQIKIVAESLAKYIDERDADK